MPMISTPSVQVFARESEVITRRVMTVGDGIVIAAGTPCEVKRVFLSIKENGEATVRYRLETIVDNDAEHEPLEFTTKFMKPERVGRYLELAPEILSESTMHPDDVEETTGPTMEDGAS